MDQPTGTVTLLFTDVASSTATWEQFPEQMAVALRRHDAIMREAVEAHGGSVFKTVGDAFCTAFRTARDAIAAAEAAQRALVAEPWPAPLFLSVRMALHTGACEERAADYFGPAVNRVARLEELAHGGQVVVSAATAELLRDASVSGLVLRDLGEQRLRDLSRPERVFQADFPGLERDFPPLRSLNNPALPNNLPALPASFVGRERELSEVRTLIESERLVTLAGAGGSGKTRLALQAAAQMLDGSGDGVWLVELAPVADEEAVSASVAAALGIPTHTDRSPFESLLSVLAGLNALVVLDNCEHLVGACAKLTDAVLRACPGVHILVTSREPLGIGGETVYRVPSLSMPDNLEPGAAGLTGLAERSDAVALFLDRARSQGVNLAEGAVAASLVAALCRRLDGMPLAIELAAARLCSLSLADLVERLDHRFRLLTGGSRNALPRQQTLRATVDWSYSLLTPSEQSLLRRVSTFVEGFDLHAVESVCTLSDLDALDAAELLGSLVDKSLVVAEPHRPGLRYHLLETIRQYAAERLVEHENEAEATWAAHCAYYLAFAEEACAHLRGREQGRYIAALDDELANCRRAMERCADEVEGPERLLRFAVALGRYWWMRKRSNEVVELVLPRLDNEELDVEPSLLAQTWTQSALALAHHDRASSHRCAERAATIARRLDDTRVLAEALGVLAAARYFIGDHSGSVVAAEEAIEHARVLGDDSVLAACLLARHLGGFEDGAGQKAEGAVAAGAEAILCAERAGDLYLLASLRNNVACMWLVSGDVVAARDQLAQAEQLAAQISLGEDPILCTNVGWVLREESRHEESVLRFKQTLRLGRRTGAFSSCAYGLLGLACCAGDLGRSKDAALLHGAAATLGTRVGEPWQMPEARYRESSLTALRAVLGESEFERLAAAGGTLSFDEACVIALSGSD